MRDLVYISDVSPWWTMERQEAALTHVLGSSKVFRDALGTQQRRAHMPESLAARSLLLRPSTRRENTRVYVASWTVLAWDQRDLEEVLELLAKRRWQLVSIEEPGQVCTPETWKAARAKSRVEGAQKRGAAVSAAKRRAASDAKIDEYVRPFWHLKEPGMIELCKAAGVAVNTAVTRLGPRSKAQWEHEYREKQRAARRAKREGA